MHVALVTDTLETGGGLEHLFQTVRALERVRFSLFARGGCARHRFQGLENAAVHPQGFGRPDVLRSRPDLVHFHHLRPLFHFLRFPAPPCGVPLLFTAHGLHARKYDHSGLAWGRAGRLLRGGLERRLFRRVDRVIAVSAEDERYLRERVGLENTVRIPNGVDVRALDQASGSREDRIREFHLPAGASIFLTVARFVFQKGYDVLLEAVRIGRDRFRQDRARFLLVGEGRERARMERLARRHAVSDLVRFAGERADIPGIMKVSDLFVLPSRWEGLPIALLEASVCGLPLVASDACGNREIVRHGVNGLLFRNGNPADLCRVLFDLLDPERREALRPAEDPSFRERHDIARTARELERLYRDCLAGR